MKLIDKTSGDTFELRGNAKVLCCPEGWGEDMNGYTLSKVSVRKMTVKEVYGFFREGSFLLYDEVTKSVWRTEFA